MSFPKSIAEADRGTGRTTRMLEDVRDTVLSSGLKALVIGADRDGVHDIRKISEKIMTKDQMDNLFIMTLEEHDKGMGLDLDMSTKVSLDHAAIEARFGSLIDAWLKYQ